MRTSLRLSVVLLTFICACSTKPDVQSAQSVSGQISKALNAKDTEQLSATLADDAVLLRANEPAIVGRNAIVLRYTAAFKQVDYDVSLSSEEMEPFGDYAIDRGRFEGNLKSKDGRSSVPVFGRYFHVLKWQPDGGWKIWRATWTFGKPAEATSCDATGTRSCCCKDIGGNDCIKRPDGGCGADYPISILLP